MDNMDNLLDSLWELIEIYSLKIVAMLDTLVSPLEVMGPVPVIFILAFSMVFISTVIRAAYSTKRHKRLKQEFEYWYNLRQEATNHADTEKGKAIAKNIDQAELNRAYYDYFFEGFLKTLVTTWLPILLMLAYVNTSYNPTALAQRFGSDILFVMGPVKASSIFWYFISVLLSFAGIALGKYLRQQYFNKKNTTGKISDSI